MSFIIDGSNLLGKMGLDRESEDDKRLLAQALAAFARRRKTRVLCVFDGPRTASFGAQLGGLTVEFSGKQSADDIIVARIAARSKADQLNVVTGDRDLARRVGARKTTVVNPSEFAFTLGQLERDESVAPEHWEAYFADPKNKNI